jgi:hypothetical protein
MAGNFRISPGSGNSQSAANVRVRQGGVAFANKDSAKQGVYCLARFACAKAAE